MKTSGDGNAINCWEPAVNLDALNRFVLLIIGLFAALLYLVMVIAGFSELISRMSKAKGQRKSAKTVAGRVRRNRPDLEP
jgi:hypothetical protein